MLAANNIDSQECANGVEALNILKRGEQNFDLAIVDFNMPYMNGLDMIKEINNKGISLPIVIMSAHTESEYITKANEYGVENYLLKPFDFIKFIELITSMGIKK